ncbi:MAG TPA: 23S rRNA (adenine(2503)-C(2))-methyltransferase RlmN [Oligoflexia bacterium]|nr:23S rRNA (adenine(2503)-C(2))-methyltransferase RlmN [Oligoflexia bacterium]HMR24136.1 23S rRNA (adenine(2503)-C(2))-methyltransferase RlmN [Oligoflexia bacterium]
MTQNKQILVTTLSELQMFMLEQGFPKFRAEQIFNWIYGQGCDDFFKMSNLPKELIKALSENFSFPKLSAEAYFSKDGTIKYRFNLTDNALIESVWMPEEDRATLCVSSQAGCALKCAFCVTGTLGLKRNLSVEEIVYQIWYISKKMKKRITNLVFMGMGEPLQNMNNLVAAIEMLKSKETYAFGKRKITVSTVGLANRIKPFLQQCDVNLAISLTGFNDKDRDYWMPINKTFDLKRLKHELSGLSLGKGRKITFEVVLIQGRTDREQDAYDLAKFLKGLKAKVNLIPYNENKILPEFKSPREHNIERFREILKEQGIISMVRKNRGQDIMGACGQLAAKDVV